MSYSLEEKCFTCTKKEKCSDGQIIRGAIDTIHQLGEEKGHLGYGVVRLDCSGHTTETADDDDVSGR